MTFWSALILGLLASVHCAGMCGGLQAANTQVVGEFLRPHRAAFPGLWHQVGNAKTGTAVQAGARRGDNASNGEEVDIGKLARVLIAAAEDDAGANADEHEPAAGHRVAVAKPDQHQHTGDGDDDEQRHWRKWLKIERYQSSYQHGCLPQI